MAKEKTGLYLGLKVGFILITVLLLLIPMSMISSVVEERQGLGLDVEHDIATTWGGNQIVSGPILKVPYLYRTPVYNKEGKVTRYAVHTNDAYFLPKKMVVDGTQESRIKSRGLFKAYLYDSDLKISGQFEVPDFSDWKVPAKDILWDRAVVFTGVSDTKALTEEIKFVLGGKAHDFEPMAPKESHVLYQGMKAKMPGLKKLVDQKDLSFSYRLKMRGSRELFFRPMAEEVKVTLQSNWPHPSFEGDYLPDSHTITEDGYTANWKVLYLGRSYPQKWLNAMVMAKDIRSDFGVRMVQPVNVYSSTDRATKYAVLFVTTTFVVFFLFEILVGLRIHPLQYGMVGGALCLFYLLLLSLSEQMAFGSSYLIASAATVSLITGYSLSVLRMKKRALLLGGFLSLIYSYLYVLLRAEDFALLLGSVGLFVLMAAMMYATRKVDWYQIRKSSE